MQTNLWTCALRDVHPSDARTSLVSVSHYLYLLAQLFVSNKLCAWRHDMPPPLSSPRGRPIASRAAEQTQRSSSFHAKYVLTVTAAPALRVKAALSKATFWPWKWCPCPLVMWATSVPFLVFLGLSVLELGPMYATDRRQTSTKASLNAPAY